MSNSILATKQSVDEGLAKKLDIDVGAANKGRILIVQPGGRFEVDDIPRATVIRDSTVATHEGLATELAVATKIEQLSYDSKHLIYVDPDYTGLTSRGTRTQPYKTLTLAIDATGAGDQDVIVLNPGVYPPDPVKGETVLNNADNSIIGISTSQQARTKLLGNLLISGDRFGVQDLLVDGKVSIDADNTYFDNLTTTGDLNKDAINSTPNAYSYVRDSVIGGNVTVKRGVLYLENVNLEKGVVQLLGGTLITKNCSGVTINALGGQYIDLGGSYFTTHAAQSDASIKCDSGVALAYIESGISGDLTTGFKPIVMNAQVYYLGSLQFDYDASTIGNGTRLPGGLQSRQIVDGKTRTGYTTTGDYVNQHLDGISDALESIRTLAEQGLKTPKSVAYENTIYAAEGISIIAPTSMFLAKRCLFFLHSAFASSNNASACSISSMPEIMGNIMRTFPSTLARSMARNCTLNNPGLERERRIARQPSRWFFSFTVKSSGTTLSPPTSEVLMVTGRFPMALSTRL